jgi:serine phosphatase RsbU (regulator of sigma subunit)
MSALSADRGIVQLPLFSRPLPATRRPPAVHAISIPARAFTGDFYFTYRTDDRLSFALGDVAGKGLSAAVVMAMIQEELEELTHRDPAGSMLRLHTFLRPLIPGNRFATAVIGHLSDDGALVMANAGHCPPLITRTSGAIEEIGSTGPVIGILRSPSWQTFETTLRRGESLVLYTDGVIEAEDFGLQRLAAALSGNTPREIAENILTSVNRHAGDVRSDDLTIVVLRR